MSNTNLDVAVCVVGAGPVGATLACRLGAAGLPVAIVDRAALPPMEHPDFDGRAYAIAASSRRLLEAAGVWSHLPLPSCPIEGIRVSDGKPGQPASPLFLHFDHHEVGEPFGWMTEARSLRVALNATLHAMPAIVVAAPTEASVTRTDQAAIVRTTDGRTIRAQLVVAAEGRESPLRRQAGIAVTRFGYRQAGLVCAIAHTKPHHNHALEHFLPGGPFAQLPMAPTEGAPHLSAIVWSERDAVARKLMALDDTHYANEIQRRLGSHLGDIRLVGRRWLYPLSALHAHSYVATRLALIGDAAHGIHPIAGQGLNLGFRDVEALAGLLTEAHAGGTDLGDPELLRRYQAARRPANLAMLAATDLLDRLFSNDNPALRLVRDLGIAGVHRMPRLRRAFMTAAMGGGRS
ncbi:UbiH/UbiF/VisC/COQ6 family ubiquinone biosynthesis hydroxylase [Lichenicola cladoniae]|uniref:UbiH/UbiF/VisC/COQ6 family ubiquinone biosynthesis hydroxylase n=1 Tax=Lichenicola cladoniae TaxID=1484109 RepID=A0A6M8HLD2_9PROT|nr:UbiH/UbiF/VisC/COQ6 family ubiquinone biosynthesis hydroxylase [Lichenicola cladoniae]NPD68900.1 UbiH/UbiF/VisC/COQ6 family ubiquinone biosynthesis hydroxylase [Acetobacteraceae bacterium]QKE89152.1 UbiH/UbiF/VisC/COQ6 family ubiquinone biosynthesis hydroxylase [Lichenicola cladoniae]